MGITHSGEGPCDTAMWIPKGNSTHFTLEQAVFAYIHQQGFIHIISLSPLQGYS